MQPLSDVIAELKRREGELALKASTSAAAAAKSVASAQEDPLQKSIEALLNMMLPDPNQLETKKSRKIEQLQQSAKNTAETKTKTARIAEVRKLLHRADSVYKRALVYGNMDDAANNAIDTFNIDKNRPVYDAHDRYSTSISQILTPGYRKYISYWWSPKEAVESFYNAHPYLIEEPRILDALGEYIEYGGNYYAPEITQGKIQALEETAQQLQETQRLVKEIAVQLTKPENYKVALDFLSAMQKIIQVNQKNPSDKKIEISASIIVNLSALQKIYLRNSTLINKLKDFISQVDAYSKYEFLSDSQLYNLEPNSEGSSLSHGRNRGNSNR